MAVVLSLLLIAAAADVADALALALAARAVAVHVPDVPDAMEDATAVPVVVAPVVALNDMLDTLLF